MTPCEELKMKRNFNIEYMAAPHSVDEQSRPTTRDQEQGDREFSEAWSREWLSKIGLRLLRSGMKPGELGEPAYRIISTNRLTIMEVCKLTADLCNADFESLRVNEKRAGPSR
jgi:hypothetical protein